MCSGSDILKVAAVAATVYTGGAAAGLWGGAGAVGTGGALAAGEIAAGTALGGELSVAAATAGSAIGGTAAAGGTALGGAGFMSGLKTAAQLAPLASLAMLASQPQLEAPGVAAPAAPPKSVAATTQPQSIFKKKLAGLGSPTALTGPGGVDSADLTLGKATILGS